MAEAFARIDANVMNEGRTIFVTDEIIEVVTTAAEAMPNAPLREDMLPEPNGVLILGEVMPYWNPLDGEDSFPLRAIAWYETEIELPESRETTTGITLICYTDSELVRWKRDEWGMGPWPKEMGSMPPLYPIDLTAWGFGVEWGEAGPDEERGEFLKAPHIAYLRRWLLALWVFMADEIVPMERDPRVPRPVEKRAKRGWPKKHWEDGMATVVHLRRQQPRERDEREDDEEREPVMWSHSWIVRGHWRKLKDRETGEWTGRVTWVRPHIKGDGPLVLKERLVLVHR
jgi:hypothetical protein